MVTSVKSIKVPADTRCLLLFHGPFFGAGLLSACSAKSSLQTMQREAPRLGQCTETPLRFCLPSIDYINFQITTTFSTFLYKPFQLMFLDRHVHKRLLATSFNRRISL